ncbi:hypothetical protein ACWDYJ_22055 [Streptomyces sp. NPDC003042]
MTPPKTDPPRTRVRAGRRLAAVMGPLCALVAAWLLLVAMPGALDEEHRFRAAVDCASGGGAVPGGRDDDCLRTTVARIDRTESVKGRKTASYWLYVTEADGTSTRTRLEGRPQDPPVAREAARVEVTYWQGQIRYVDFESARRYTNADPRGDYRLFCAFGLALGFYGTGWLWAWYWSAPSRAPGRAYPPRVTVPFVGAVCLTFVGAAAPWPTDNAGAALRLAGVSAVMVLAACSVAVLFLGRRQSDGDDTVAMTPSVPVTEQCFLGVIVGEVRYEGTGGYLVAGPARLASTPDPTGAAFRREVPHSLTPVRVRPPYLTDPDYPDYGGRTVVLECEDNGVPVLVVTHRKHMPWVLGALQPAPDPSRPRP